MTDTDSDMMRRQQNMDTPQTIEGKKARGPADLDDGDGRDRRRALEGFSSGPGSQDTVLAQNARGAPAERKAGVAGGGRPGGGLVRKGRSLLGA